MCWARGPATAQVEHTNTLCHELLGCLLGVILVLGALETLETTPTARGEQLVTLIVCSSGKHTSTSIPLQM